MMESVVEIIDEAQRSESTHNLCGKRLSTLLKKNKATTLEFILRGCMDRVFIFPKKHEGVSRIIKFFGLFIASVEEDTMNAMLNHICSRFSSSNKLVRQRSCQLLAECLQVIDDKNIEVACDVIEILSELVLPRLNDKVPTVRQWAVKAASKLQDPTNDGDKVISEITRLMNTDSSAPVRLAAVESIIIVDSTLLHLLSRQRDVKAEIRIATLKRISSIPVRQIPIEFRASLVKSSLADREEKVRQEATSLVMKWLASLDDNVPNLLRMINPLEREEESLLLGAFIMEEMMREDFALSNNLKGSIKEPFDKWDAGISQINPTEIMWVYIRCNYARKFCSSAISEDICDSLLPDPLQLCEIISSIHTNLISYTSTAKKEFVVKYLIKSSSLIDPSNVSGVTQLMDVYQQLICEVSTPFEMIDSLLHAYGELHNGTGNQMDVKSLFGKLMSCARDVKNMIDTHQSPTENKEDDIDILTERTLQIIHWAVKNVVGNAKDIDNLEHIKDMFVPFIIQCLQQPNSCVRCLAIGCLGLMCLCSEDLCRRHRGIIVQVASGDFEEEAIQCEALKCLIDMTFIYPDISSNDLTNVLSRLQECGDINLVRTACEGATKVLYHGSNCDARLMATSLKFFFLPELLPKTSSTDDADNIVQSNLAHLQQFLSIFFSTFMNVNNINYGMKENMVIDSITYVVADITIAMKDGNLELNSMNKIVKHFLSMLSGSQNTSTLLQANERIFLTVCREILRLGNTKWVDKALNKEFVKLLPSCDLESWVTIEKAVVMLSVIEAVLQSTQHDKPSLKTLEQLKAICENIIQTTEPSSEPQMSGIDMLSCAPGLSDLVELGAKQSGRLSGDSHHSGSSKSTAILLKQKQRSRKAIRRISEDSDSASESEHEVQDENRYSQAMQQRSSLKSATSLSRESTSTIRSVL